MTDVADVLTLWGSDASEADVAEVLNITFRGTPDPRAAVLSCDALTYLAEHGGVEAAEQVAAWEPEREQRRRSRAAITGAAQLVAGTFSVVQVAEQLGVDPSRVRHLINDQPARLYATKVGSRRRIPAWQIHDGGLLSGLDRLVPAIPVGAHPLDVAGLMTTPQDELGGRSAIEHLTGGGDVEPVTNLLADLGRW